MKLSDRLSKLDIPKSMCVPAVRVSTTTLFLNLVERVEQNVSVFILPKAASNILRSVCNNKFVNDRISEKLTKRKVYQEGDETRQGLGRLPMNLPSVDSMLLFNSDENPYQNYSTFDNLLSSLLKKEKTRDLEDENPLADAPSTFGEDFELKFEGGLKQLGFMPTLNEEDLPTINLPSLNLPNVAEDITLNNNHLGSSIAPSNLSLEDISLETEFKVHEIVLAPRNMLTMPEIIDPTTLPEIKHIPSAPSNMNLIESADPKSNNQNVPVHYKEERDKSCSLSGGENLSRIISESPGPIKEVESEMVNHEDSGNTDKLKPSPTLEIEDGRSGLLEAIRRGKKLKKAKPRKSKNIGKPSKSSPGSGGASLMDKLRERLKRHRAAMFSIPQKETSDSISINSPLQQKEEKKGKKERKELKHGANKSINTDDGNDDDDDDDGWESDV
eukprot:CAMPEP_0185252326 /NCGR_PEP_ID=MMETSP1359-20130426/1453_1 /TAXON_ID=552665 /ORGANISM="Bigelowiella longifila, Strain CCMP242" /LENGTH=442 /DNA_ID=CAMNT_0027834467 /DNA_START=488 /DNA_END=1817 /DNA_ORIENTATION=+